MAPSVRRFLVALVVAIVLLGVFASTAMASLEDTPTPTPYLGASMSNPGSGADTWWRGGWGNSLNPDFQVFAPGNWNEVDDGYLLGMIYSLNGMPVSVINTHTPAAYYRASFPTGLDSPGGTNFNNTFDLLGIWNDLALSGNPALLPQLFPGEVAHSPLEGRWYLHYVFYSNQRYANIQWDQVAGEGPVAFGIDLTPPAAVPTVTVAPGLSSPVYPANAWAPTSRGVIRWNAAHDDLSGIGYYQVLIDDQPVLPEQTSDPTQGRAYNAPGVPTPNQITIEDLPPGRHVIGVEAVDRATNASTETTVAYESDPDTPTIAWGALMGDTLTSVSHAISVDAADQAGNPFVSFYMDGSLVGTASAPPYSINPDLSALSSGTHTLSATVTDMLGRHVTITKQVTWSPSGYTVLPPGSGGDLDTPVTATTLTNPWYDFAPGDVNSDRDGWGNSLMPSFTFSMPSSAEGFLYNVVTTTGTIDPAHPELYYRANKSSGTHLSDTVDLQGIFNYPPPGGWRSAPVLGSSNPIEGPWYFQLRYYDRFGHVSSDTFRGQFNIDLTPPLPVTGLHAVPTLEPGTVGNVSASSRAHIAWDQGVYDTLSGVSYFKVLVDGNEVIPVDGIVWNIPGVIPNAATIEDLAPGRHVLSVECVDRATNVSKATSTEFYSDPDTPTVSFTSPSGSLIGVKPNVQVNAQDLGGVKCVSYSVDGAAAGTSTVAPYNKPMDLSAYAAGSHTIRATVTDMMGRTATVSKTVSLDKTSLTLSSLKVSGSGRKCAVSVVVSKPGTVRLTVPRMGVSKSLYASSAGRYAFSYTYPKGLKYPSSTSFKDSFTISATDSLGNAVSASGRWTVHISKLVRVSGNRIRVVYY